MSSPVNAGPITPGTTNADPANAGENSDNWSTAPRTKDLAAVRPSTTSDDHRHHKPIVMARKAKKAVRRKKTSAKKPSKVTIPPLPVRRDATDSPSAKSPVALPPKPDVWSSNEIESALRKCADVMKRIKAVVVPSRPIKNGACGDPAPVELVSVGENPPVTFSPPAKVNCQMVEALHTWVTRDLQRLSKKHLRASLIKIEVMSDYSCRRAYGRKKGRMSEHSKVNALDIRGFVTTKGKTARLLADWGVTKRDIKRAIAKKKKEKEKREKALVAKALAKQEAKERQRKSASKDADIDTSVNTTLRDGKKKTAKIVSGSVKKNAKAGKPSFSVAPKKLGGPKPGEPRFSPPKSSKGRFLRGAHIAGCRIFGTILGPEANNAHRNHFHVDMAPRRRSNFCQ
ncbi:MAG: extensin family protein [Hyphomicrobiaceae bacterium]